MAASLSRWMRITPEGWVFVRPLAVMSLISHEAGVAVQVGNTVERGESILAFLKEPQGV